MSDYLTDEEQMARLKSWWDENGRSLVIGLVLVIGATVTVDNTSTAADLVTTHTGRRPAAPPRSAQ